MISALGVVLSSRNMLEIGKFCCLWPTVESDKRASCIFQTRQTTPDLVMRELRDADNNAFLTAATSKYRRKSSDRLPRANRLSRHRRAPYNNGTSKPSLQALFWKPQTDAFATPALPLLTRASVIGITLDCVQCRRQPRTSRPIVPAVLCQTAHNAFLFSGGDCNRQNPDRPCFARCTW